MAGRNVPEDYLEGYARILTEVGVNGRRLTRGELESRRAVGERAAEAGCGLRDLVHAYLSFTRAACSHLPRAALDHVLSAVEQAVDALAEGHERARLVAVRNEEAARREFIDDLLYGRSDPGHLAERAERFGLLLSHTHAVAVAEGPQVYDDIHPAVQRVERALLGRFGHRRILLTTKDGRLICVAPADQDDVLMYFAKQAHAGTDGGRVAIGRPHAGAGGVVHSYEEALNALELAVRMNLEDPVLRSADLLVYPVLTRDRQAMADLVLSTLGPLTQARGGAGPMLETLSAYFDSGCNATEAARRLSLSVRALTYRLERIQQFTGANPADPAHRYTLQTAVIGARLFDWPAKEL
ncbi:helix-turn-helix domain-containing protein [Streptomyces sp. G-G2]|uniref:PucR family transcriptional regulator n=1 Tax=Streptomyces sp. G-G2 TaxID=3046201 RepID=UPI0024BBB54E|nr:helix-turn-helix domain-containing protein [Streptomyces sp. G-G2]MDJ0380142.1 helix-turn-helix domain-containing protein [Streptomyces sp. G-G2]